MYAKNIEVVYFSSWYINNLFKMILQCIKYFCRFLQIRCQYAVYCPSRKCDMKCPPTKWRKPKILHVRTFTQYTTCTCIGTLHAHISTLYLYTYIGIYFKCTWIDTLHVHVPTLYIYIYRHFTCTYIAIWLKSDVQYTVPLWAVGYIEQLILSTLEYLSVLCLKQKSKRWSWSLHVSFQFF